MAKRKSPFDVFMRSVGKEMSKATNAIVKGIGEKNIKNAGGDIFGVVGSVLNGKRGKILGQALGKALGKEMVTAIKKTKK